MMPCLSPHPPINTHPPMNVFATHLAPDAPWRVEVRKDVFVLGDVLGKALGVNGHGVLPVLVQGLQVWWW